MKKRLGMIDILRLLSVLFVFLFHSNIHMNCSYSILTPFINMGAIFMTVFFMISGFSIYYVNSGGNGFTNRNSVTRFYKKRIVSIMPMYWFEVFTYPIWDVIVNDGSIMDNLILLPIEMFGLQSVFDSLFGYTHNAGTWFISCILFCYIVFPLVYNLIKETKTKVKLFCGVVIGGILIYSPFLAEYFQLHIIYSNVFFRMIEFVIGMLLCSIWLDVNETNWYKKYIGRKTFFFGMFFVLIILVTVLVKMNIFIGNYMIYNIVALPCFVAIVFSGAGIETKIFNSSRLVKYAISISYVFFFAQLYTWDITTAIVTVLDIDTNILRIILSFVLCTIIAIIMHGIIEKPLKKVLLQKITK